VLAVAGPIKPRSLYCADEETCASIAPEEFTAERWKSFAGSWIRDRRRDARPGFQKLAALLAGRDDVVRVFFFQRRRVCFTLTCDHLAVPAS